ncbi:NPCBM/NEW2 domain-containing protein [Gimesia algae]|uniref:NPCBM/NEW2 domain protein n=1 Tax=Gimesia algae TaxID=2527971 RepID=A0A517VGM1_9PLAN|nr:NPCBM/NEW2 domain-containing protein [Gimesia algae]QDT92125.1 NPCBM/NEW2 domain protein [Gimesia algae]
MRSVVLFSLFSLVGLTIPGQVHAAELEQISGDKLDGTLIEIQQNQLTMQGKSGSKTVPAADTIRVDLGHARLSWKKTGMLILANNDRILGDLIRSEGEFLLVQMNVFPGQPVWRVPLETVTAAFFDWPASRFTRIELLNKADRPKQNHDLFFLKNGDHLQGEFISFDENSFRFDSNAGETSVPRGGIQLFCFNPDLVNFPQPDQLRYVLTLTNGTRVTVSELSLSQETVSAKTVFGASLTCPLSLIETITPRGGKAVPVSDLEPSFYRFTPYFNLKWDWQRNQNVLRGPLVTEGKEYCSGLGMHSASELRYQLDGKYAGFQTLVGLDDATTGRGDVEVLIIIDQRVVFQQPISDDQRRLVEVPRIELTGAQELILKVEFGKNADMDDHVNWLRPVLLLKQ